MELPPFLLDQWISQKHTADPPIEFDLASSTGPAWTLRELLALSDGNELEALLDSTLFYTRRGRHSGAARGDRETAWGRA